MSLNNSPGLGSALGNVQDKIPILFVSLQKTTVKSSDHFPCVIHILAGESTSKIFSRQKMAKGNMSKSIIIYHPTPALLSWCPSCPSTISISWIHTQFTKYSKILQNINFFMVPFQSPAPPALAGGLRGMEREFTHRFPLSPTGWSTALSASRLLAISSWSLSTGRSSPMPVALNTQS